MTAVQFCYWMQGFFEIAKPETATAEQLAMIQQHLNMVFVHEIDPSHGGPEEQAKLNALHQGGPIPPLNSMAAIQAHNEEAKKNGQPLMRC